MTATDATDATDGTDGTDGTDATGAPAPQVTWRRVRPPRRRPRARVVVAVLAVAALVAGIVVVSRVQVGRGPVALVTDYLSLLTAGRADDANAVVRPVDTAAGRADPALLTDAVLGASTERIAVQSVQQPYDAAPAGEVPVGSTTTVEVDYRVGTKDATVDLRVRRLPNQWSLQRWQLLDALVVPFSASSTVPSFATATLGGVSVPLSGPKSEDFPQARPVLVYPGAYAFVPPRSPWVSAPTAQVRVVHGDELGDGVSQSIRYAGTSALLARINAEARPWLEACAAAGTAADSRCPEEFGYDGNTTPVTVVSVPLIRGVGSYQTDYRGPDDWDPMLRFFGTAGGSYAIAGAGRHPYTLKGWVRVSPDGQTATVQFLNEF